MAQTETVSKVSRSSPAPPAESPSVYLVRNTRDVTHPISQLQPEHQRHGSGMPWVSHQGCHGDAIRVSAEKDHTVAQWSILHLSISGAQSQTTLKTTQQSDRNPLLWKVHWTGIGYNILGQPGSHLASITEQAPKSFPMKLRLVENTGLPSGEKQGFSISGANLEPKPANWKNAHKLPYTHAPAAPRNLPWGQQPDKGRY